MLATEDRFRYYAFMSEGRKKLMDKQIAEARARRLVGMRLQEIEGNPLDSDQIAMFEMFEREGWSHERCRAYILERARAKAAILATE